MQVQVLGLGIGPVQDIIQANSEHKSGAESSEKNMSAADQQRTSFDKQPLPYQDRTGRSLGTAESMPREEACPDAP